MNSEDIRKKHREYLFPALKNFYKEPIVITEGAGAKVKDIEGNSYLDFFGGILTISVGHANRDVNEKVLSQIERLTHISTLYPTLPVVELAEKLANIAPGQLDKCFFYSIGD